MSKNSDILLSLVNEDFGLYDRDGSRWAKSIEHDSLVIDKEKGIFYWNSKNLVGDPLYYLLKVRNLTFDSAKNYLSSKSYSGTHVYTLQEGKEVVVYPALVDTFYTLGKENRAYFYRRGINDNIIDRFQLGWYNDFSMIPFFSDGTFRNFQMRKDIPTKVIRSYYRGVGPLLYNSDILKLVDEVYYTEGPVDALALIQNGLPAVSSNSGGGYKKEWYFKFIDQKKIYLVFDNDNAGIKEASRLANFLGVDRCIIYTFSDFVNPEENGYDPVDFFLDGGTKDDLITLIREKGKHVYEIY